MAFTIALKENGEAWAWGANVYGNIGDNTSGNSRSSPVLVVGNHSFKYALVAGVIHAAAMKANGECWAWGYNSAGQLGDNTQESKSSPVKVVGGHSFIKVYGLGNIKGLKSDGSLWTWGSNGSGELGDNSITDKSSPVAVVGNHSFTLATGSSAYAFALKANGEAWCWGNNYSGELGDNTSSNSKSSPVLVAGNHSFIDLTSPDYGGSGLKSNGEVWTWGYGNYGGLGNNTTTNRSSPVLVVGGHSFSKIAKGQPNYRRGALKPNGEIWEWGYNSYGELGDNSRTNKSSPVLVVGNHSFIESFLFALASFGLKANGEIWAWGRNLDGALGDGNYLASYSSPILVIGNHNFNTFGFEDPLWTLYTGPFDSLGWVKLKIVN